ncbi:class I mannose-6-phosphate isomerase [Abyssisolibacter fermentans]|uniref:class I mannose-6-phosphate isomerase n=1 Tax=Abyssisolibacter fermentans TaxID=1766203 RepID=UPI00082E1D15|nr:class I mannose-6-phosphate isomerase [Abyssisolibacter fermentans]
MQNYDKYPEVKIKGFDNEAFEGYNHIIERVKEDIIGKEKAVVVIDFYHGVSEDEVLKGFDLLNPVMKVKADDCAYDGEKLTEMMQEYLTDDRVFGIINTKKLQDYFVKEKIEKAAEKISSVEKGIVLVYGVGAGLITLGDVYIYADLARWEIQKRYRNGMPNWKQNNYDEDLKRKYKRGFFIEWRIADRHKKCLYEKMDYVLDTNVKDNPKMITGNAFREGLKQTAERPFRVVPYFDPGVWGGQWMKEVCGLDKTKKNFAWSFDGVPEENSLYLKYGNVRVEVPSINVVLYQPVELLGDKVHARFGAEFPIRFDFLDTMGGQNLSLQVHPITEYIQENFGMHYTQDESYYILDCKEDANVYLGVKEGINKDDMINDLKRAEKGEISFPDEKYINKIPAKKHDHFLIPAGTIHCSGNNCMVLEISATPYIFTFKLWDWDRVGLDGIPRPIHIEHGKNVIQWDRTASWVNKNLVNRVEEISKTDGCLEERTGLHEREFIETRRHWFTDTVHHNTNGSVNVLNLVEGDEAVIESPTGQFEPFIVHYAETFIIPECIKEYTIKPYGKSQGKKICTIKAYIR